jgi:hypothetical protein
MKRIKTFKTFESLIYDVDWKKILPKKILVFKDGEHSFIVGNTMKHADMIQVSYENESNEWGVPSTLEFDFYFSKKEDVMRMDIDVTWGDSMACEFYIESPNKVGVIEYTSYGSKTDPSNTIFALSDDSLKSFVEFLNKFNGFRLDVSQFTFLDKNDNFQQK